MEYLRLLEIDAHQLWLAGHSITFIAGRANTTTWFVRRWLRDVTAPADGDTVPADPM
jgi:hypothetical protein